MPITTICEVDANNNSSLESKRVGMTGNKEEPTNVSHDELNEINEPLSLLKLKAT